MYGLCLPFCLSPSAAFSLCPLCDVVTPAGSSKPWICEYDTVPSSNHLSLENPIVNRISALGLSVALFALLSVGDATAQETLPPNNQSDFHLFLLVGQSNMAGRGKIDPADNEGNPRVLTLSKSNQWVMATDPLHFDKPRVVGVGLGRSFAQEILRSNPDAVIGLIPCAAGGSPIRSWEPGGYHGQTKSHPYDDAIKRLKVAQQSGTVKAILWHQGESDSKPKLAEVYESKLHELISRLRKEVGADVPFIAGQLGQFPEKPWDQHRKKVDAAHRSLPQKVSNTAFVDSDGLVHKGDKTHFDTKSYREFGKRYAKAYLLLSSSAQAKPATK